MLLGARGWTWRSRLREARQAIVVDPLDADFGAPARIWRLERGELKEWKFFGALDPTANPIDLLRGFVQLLAAAGPDALVKLFDWREGPLARKLALALAEIAAPDQIFVPESAEVPLDLWPVGPERVSTEAQAPSVVLGAQRRARWLELIEQTVEVELDLRQTPLLGSRLGSGHRLDPEMFWRAGLERVRYAERSGSSLLVVSDGDLTENGAARAMNLGEAKRLHHVETSDYAGLICCGVKADGSDYAPGFVEAIDFGREVIQARLVGAPPFTPVGLRLGLLRIDASGRELAELKPWAV